MPTESTEFLYTPPPGAHDHEEELLAWHKRMNAEYKLVDKSQSHAPKTLYRWLRKAGVDRNQMGKYGISLGSLGNMPWYDSETSLSIFDHVHVLQRRSDGAMFILAEPYADLSRLKKHHCLQAWSALGGEVTCSNESGWLPRNTVSVLIGEPRGHGTKTREGATK